MKVMPMRALNSLLLIAASLALAACSHAPSVKQPEIACSALVGRSIPAASIGLPSGPAAVRSATLTAAVPEFVNGNSVTPSAPEYCKVLGSVAPRDPNAQAINFQVNLPVQWNGKALQYGGGGFNGTLITGLAPLRDAAPGDPLPIARGYATFGTDSGHQASASPASEPGAFALNDEMLENFA